MSDGSRHFIYMLMLIPAIMIATTIHEFTRAAVSTILGDTTPRNEGRLTINPFKHFEPIGFLLLYATGLSYGGGFGWGLPVNTNPRHYKNRRLGVVLTATLPSLVNFAVAVVSNYIIFRIIAPNTLLTDFLLGLRSFNLYLVICNLFPVAPFDGLKILLEFVSRKNYFTISQQESVMQLILMILLFSGLLTYVTTPLFNILLLIVNLLTI